MKNNRIVLIIVALLISGCRAATTQPAPTIDNSLVATIVAATLNAPKPATETIEVPVSPTAEADTPEPSATSTPTQAPSPTAMTGEVSGRICYRTANIPAMTAFFQEADMTDEKETNELKIDAGQNNYNIDLTPGTYIAFAWVEDYSLGGLYSEAVPCGMRSNCLDHTPIKFEVRAGENVEGIDICDWYAFSIPQPPDRTQDEIRGRISGQISHPEGTPPELHLVAFNLDTSYWYYALTLAGATNFTIPNLPPGTYQIVAYEREGRAGGYADSSHALIAVVVRAGETSSTSISDWNAPPGTFPSDPTEW